MLEDITDIANSAIWSAAILLTMSIIIESGAAHAMIQGAIEFHHTHNNNWEWYRGL